MTLWIGFGYVALMNLVTFGAFFVDKRSAIRGTWRISEKTLLGLALLGGSLGAKLAQSRLRHKTRKQPFARLLNLIVGIQCLCLVGALYLGLQPAH